MSEQKVGDIRQERKSLYEKIMRWLWILLGVGVLGTIIFFLALSRSDLPSLKELENPKSEVASQIYGDNMEVIGRYYIENRIPVSYQQLSNHIVNALVATEDERYYQHAGIDFEALGRVLFKSLVLRQDAGGGSTITQQLAKLLFTGTPGSGLERALQKFKEWIIALRLERSYTKEEIIAMYLNKFDFIYDADGIKAAAEIYFGKDQKDLNVEEAAMLVGMLKNPSLYNPRRFPERAKQRRDVVLFQMRKNGILSDEKFEYYKSKPVDMRNFKRSTQSEGLAPYFRAELAKDVRRILAKQAEVDGKNYDIYRDGFKIYTTINPELQRMAEKAMVKHMKKLQKDFFMTWKRQGADPWKSRANDEIDPDKKLRNASLDRLIGESERYQRLRDQYLGEVAAKLETELGRIWLRDVDINRMFRAEKEDGYLVKLQQQKFISSEMTTAYRKVMRSEHYKELRSQWNKLQATVKVDFMKPVDMTVFAYNDEMETDTVMTPLDSIKYHRMMLQIGSLAVDPFSGEVKAWVGGVNHEWFKFDHVRSRRQVGSTFKPFVYATAISRQGFSPCFKVDDMPYTINPGESNFDLIKEWAPSNSNGKWTYEPYTLKDALQRSKNSITVYLLKQIGSVDPVINMMDGMGIDKESKYPNGRPIIPRVPSIVLGAADLEVWEMAGAYTTFANNGIHSEPYHIRKIEDKNGRVLFEQTPQQSLALKPEYNYVMLDLLKHVNSRWGGFNSIKTKHGGKTGTTNSYVDGWYMGITPNLVVGTWVGGEDRWVRFTSLARGQGGYMARPFFRDLIYAIEQNEDFEWDTSADFKRPNGDIGIELDCEAYEQLNNTGGFDENDDPFFDDGFGDELNVKGDSTKINF